jgi:hypothetical protein
VATGSSKLFNYFRRGCCNFVYCSGVSFKNIPPLPLSIPISNACFASRFVSAPARFGEFHDLVIVREHKRPETPVRVAIRDDEVPRYLFLKGDVVHNLERRPASFAITFAWGLWMRQPGFTGATDLTTRAVFAPLRPVRRPLGGG